MKKYNENSMLFKALHTPSLVVGTIMISIIVLAMICQPLLTSYDANANDYGAILQGPSAAHWLGTDNFGRDLFTRILEGGKVSLMIGVEVLITTTVLGTCIALVGGYYEKVDIVIMRVMDVIMAFPQLLVAMVLSAVFGNNIGGVTLALTIVYTPRTVRMLRSSILTAKEEVYVEAAQAIGVRPTKIMFKHILPAALPTLIVQETYLFAGSILAEAGISFIGCGVTPPDPSWGNILSDATTLLRQAPWTVYAPGIAIIITVMSLQLIGDGLREILDPKRSKGKARG